MKLSILGFSLLIISILELETFKTSTFVSILENGNSIVWTCNNLWVGTVNQYNSNQYINDTFGMISFCVLLNIILPLKNK